MNNRVIGNDSDTIDILNIQIVLNFLFIIGIIVNTFFALNQKK